MKKLFAVAALALTLLIAPQVRAQKAPTPVTSSLNQSVYDSVVLLYTQDGSGDMKMVCTATAYEVKPSGSKSVYRFVSAAHCVDGNDDAQQKLEKFYVSSDQSGEKSYIAAKLIQAGDKTQGDDFSVFEVTTADKFVITPLGDDTLLKNGDLVVNVAGALGFGKQFFQGYVSEQHMDRPPVDAGEVLWTDLMLVEIGGGPGSSGSSIVSVDQKAIVGFLVGAAQQDIGKLCVPVSKFKTFIALVDAGKYKKSKASDKAPSSDL